MWFTLHRAKKLKAQLFVPKFQFCVSFHFMSVL